MQEHGISHDDFREELLEAVKKRLPASPTEENLEYAFSCEIGDRLTQAEEFQDFIPNYFMGTGSRNRKLRVDGYEQDEADDSIRLVITDFTGGDQPGIMTRTRAETLFKQLGTFVEDAVSGRIWSNVPTDMADRLELAGIVASKHSTLSRYRFYLFTDAILSDRIKDLPLGEIDGNLVEYHIWDIGRIHAISLSALGAEELEIDFTQFVPEGLPCLEASHAHDYEGYLVIIPGDVLAELYDSYGSKLLEGNVRSFLSVRGKINKGIQGTIRSEPERFFIYNNGISVTATAASVVKTSQGQRLLSAKYFQIVNGGQTTASLHLARHKDKADLSGIHVQMKLSVVTANKVEKLDDMIESIAMYSNRQNKVSDADFFSNHPYHRAFEKLSRRISAPASAGAQYQTYWYYERARGQYLNAQLGMKPSQRRDFQRKNPRSQLVVKTDIAKFENSWSQLPHVVSTGAQKNFKIFAEYIGKKWGEYGHVFDNDIYYKKVISHAILFRSMEKMVSASDWYQGGYRANIVTYTIAKLANMIEQKKPGHEPDLMDIWKRQSLSSAMTSQLGSIAKEVTLAITTPPIEQMNITEWCKKKECWAKVQDLQISLYPRLASELISPENVRESNRTQKQQGTQDAGIHAVTEVISRGAGYWISMTEWAQRFSPLYGKEADLVRNASRTGWMPTDRQAVVLIGVIRRLEEEGFIPPVNK